MKNSARSVVLSFLMIGLGLVGKAEAATLTNLEVAFIIDGSTSISNSDYEQQLQAYQNIFNDENFYRQVLQPAGSIAVSVLQFAFSVVQEVDWTVIDSFQTAQAFGNQFTLSNMPQLNQSSSRLGTAIQAATFGNGSTITGVFNNNIQGDHLVVDLNTDGFFLGGTDPLTTANNAKTYAQTNNLGFVINALSPTLDYSPDLPFIIGGANANGSPAFISVADNINEYETVLSNHLGRELEPSAPLNVPEPNPLLGLLSIAMLGLGRQGKKRINE